MKRYIVHPVMGIYGKKYTVSDLNKRSEYRSLPIMHNTDDPIEAGIVCRDLNSAVELCGVTPSVYPPLPYDDFIQAQKRTSREGFYRKNSNGIY